MRYFKCRECGHRMRLKRSYCGRCYMKKRWFQRTALYVSPFVTAGLLLMGASAVVLSAL